MSTSPFICPKVERALAGLIEAEVAGLSNVYTGLEHDVVNEDGEQTRRELPCVECVCQSSQFDGHPSGSHIAQASVMVRANADDTTATEFEAQVKSVWDVLIVDNIADQLNTYGSDFYCDGVVWESQGWQIVGRSWVAELVMEIHCAGQTIPAE